MPSSDKTTSTTNTTKVELPPWVDQGGQDNYALAQQIAQTPYKPYTGGLVADMDNNANRGYAYNDMNNSVNSILTGAGKSSSMLDNLSAPGSVGLNGYMPSTVGTSMVTPSLIGSSYVPGMVGLNGYTPSMVKAQQVAAPSAAPANVNAANITDADIQKYFNPYENQVVDATQKAGQQSIDASQRANSDAAIAAGAFGSSRHGVTEGVTAAQGAQNIAQTVAGVRSAGFNTALSAAQGDASRTDAMSVQNQNKDANFQDLLSRIGIANQGADLSAQTSNQGALADRARMQLSADQGNQGALADAARMRLSADTSNQNASLSAQTANQGALLSASTANQNAAADAARMRLSADQGNQTAGLNYNSQLIAGSGQRLANGTAVGGAFGNASQMQMNDAILRQQTDQSQLNANYQQFLDQQNYPTEQLNLRLAALGMTPYGKTTTSNGTTTESGGDNPFLTAIGGLSSMKGLFGFSDPALKKNVKTEGKGPNGLTVKSFDYRQDKGVALPKGRQIGYMADEVEKKMPDAVRRVPIGNGKTARQVDYAKTGRPGVFGFAKHKAA